MIRTTGGRRHGRRSEESGFALLLVFVLAASIAIGLYMEMPRVAFESQRAREQLAIDRGTQYQRAIQLFYRKYQTYPQNLDDLETARNIRFLRRRYLDPLTGKEWRLVHVGPGGVLTDSANPPTSGTQAVGTQPGQPGGPATGMQNAATQTVAQAGTPSTGQTGTPDPNAPPVNPGLNMASRRPSDRLAGNGPEQPQSDTYSNPVPQQYAQQTDPNAAQPQFGSQPQFPGQPGNPGQPQFPGQDPSQAGQPQPQPGAQLPGQQLGFTQYPGQPVQYPGQVPQPQDPSQQPQYPGQTPTAQDPSQPPTSYPVYPGQPGYPQYPGQTGVPQYPNQPGVPQYPSQPTQPYPGQLGAYTNPAQQQFGAQAPGYSSPPTTPPVMPGGQPYYPFQQSPVPAAYPGQVNPQTGVPGPPIVPGQPAVPGQGANQAVSLIQQMLQSPRTPPAGANTGTVTTGASGIAGVGGSADGTGIHVIKDHSKYKQWEFIYDIKNDKSIVGAAAAANPQLLLQQQQQQQVQPPVQPSPQTPQPQFLNPQPQQTPGSQQ